MGDYPDYCQDVVRTPIQANPYQTFGVLNFSAVAVAYENDTYIYNIPNDGLGYTIDTVFFYWAENLPFACVLYTAPLQSVPVWSPVGADTKEYCCEVVPSKLGALKLIYPNALKFVFSNTRNKSITWYVCMTYFTFAQ